VEHHFLRDEEPVELEEPERQHCEDRGDRAGDDHEDRETLRAAGLHGQGSGIEGVEAGIVLSQRSAGN
jgi:hypothetical protein